MKGGDTMKKSTLKQLAVASIMTLALLFFAMPLLTQAQPLDFGINGDNSAENIGLGNRDLKDTVSQIIRIILSFLGILAVIIILWGGFVWMTALGDEGKVETAKKLIVAGIIGIVIILSAYAIATFVINNINNATTTGV